MSSIYFFGLLLLVNLVIAALCWRNSPNARARLPGKGGQLFWALFLMPAPFIVAMPAAKGLSFLLGADILWTGLAVGLLVIGLEIWLRVPQTLSRAYDPRADGA